MVGDPRFGRAASVLLLASLPALLLLPGPLRAACDPCTPAIPVPQSLWGALEPLDAPTGPLPALRDSSIYTGAALQFPDSGLPLFTSIDIEGGYGFVSYSSGFEIWDLSSPPAIVRVGLIDGWRGDFLRWTGFSENRWLIWDVDAPENNSDLVATAGYVGIAIWDTRVKSNPVQAYQDGLTATGSPVKVANSVWAATLADGRSYAFLASSQNVPGLFVYDMTAALELLPSPCAEDASVAIACPGVYKGQVGTAIAYWVDGIQVGGRTFIAFGSGLASGNAGIWDVTDPTQPVPVVTFLGGSWPHAAAFWQEGGKTYLGVRTSTQAQIYDLTACVDGDGCASSEIVQTWAAALGGSAAHFFVTFSRAGATPILYFGSDNKNTGGLQREFLYDVSDPAAPVEISPHTTANLGGDTVDYWGYYYSGNASGFNQVMPRVAKFDGLDFYRVAWTIFDIHRYAPPPPPPPPPFFTDGFESGDTSAWTVGP